mgnify:FL=1
MSSEQHRPKIGGNPYAISELPAGIDCIIDVKDFNARYRAWLRRRGFTAEADQADAVSKAQTLRGSKRREKKH